MAFKIADAYVAVTLRDDGIEEDLKARLEAAGAAAGDVGGRSLSEHLNESLATDEEAAAAFARELSAHLDEEIAPVGHDAAHVFADEFDKELGGSLSDLTQRQLNNALGPNSGWVSGLGNMSRKTVDELMAGIESGEIELGPAQVMNPDGTWGSKVISGARRTGQEAGRQTSFGLVDAIVAGVAAGSPLIAGAFAAAPGLLFAGLDALVLRSNQAIKDDFSGVEQTVSVFYSNLGEAAIPQVEAVLGDLNIKLAQNAGAVQQLFVDGAAYIQPFADGIENLALNLIPGLDAAERNGMAQAQAISGMLGDLGTGLGDLFANSTHYAAQEAEGITALGHVVSSLLGTIGSVASGLAGAVGPSLQAVSVPLDGIIHLLGDISKPAVAGGALGAFAAFKLGGPIQSGLESASTSLLKFATVEGEIGAAGATGIDEAVGRFGGLKAAAGTAGEQLGGLATFLGGPWGIALAAGAGAAIPLISDLVDWANHTNAVTLNTQSLTQAMQSSAGAIGTTVEQVIAQQNASNGLDNTLQSLGVNLGQFTAAVVGSSRAQATVMAQAEALPPQYQAIATVIGYAGNSFDDLRVKTGQWLAEHTSATGAATGTTEALRQEVLLAQQSYAGWGTKIDTVRTSMAAQAAQVAAAAKAQQQMNQAIQSNTTAVLAQTGAIQSSAYQAANATPYFQGAAFSLQAIGQAADETAIELNAADTAWNTMSGDLSSASALLNVQGDLAKVSTQTKSLGTSLDTTTSKGVQLSQFFTSSLSHIEAFGTAQIKAGGDIDATSKTMAAQIVQLEQNAIKAGVNKDAIASLISEETGIPKSLVTTMNIPGLTAYLDGMNQAAAAAAKIPTTINTTVSVFSGGGTSGVMPTLRARASGGPVYQGESYQVGEQGVERYWVAPADGYITPHGYGGPSPYAAAGMRGAGPVVHNYFQYFGTSYPTAEMAAQQQRDMTVAIGRALT